jgi:hypothetical protein
MVEVARSVLVFNQRKVAPVDWFAYSGESKRYLSVRVDSVVFTQKGKKTIRHVPVRLEIPCNAGNFNSLRLWKLLLAGPERLSRPRIHAGPSFARQNRRANTKKKALRISVFPLNGQPIG